MSDNFRIIYNGCDACLNNVQYYLGGKFEALCNGYLFI